MNIKISKELAALCSEASLLILEYEAEVKGSSKELLALLDTTIEGLQSQYTLEDISKLPPIEATRAAYRQLGKSPSAYRNAAEAMLRRIIKGNGLYQINNVVEINNLISISTGYSVGSYDTACLSGEILWKPSSPGETYQGIGKDALNIEHLPTLYDAQGAFGNPTSDSRRAMISPGKHQIMSVLYSFSGKDDLEKIASSYQELLTTYCGVEKSEVRIIP